MHKDYNFAGRAAVYDSSLEGKLSQKFYNLLLREIKLNSEALVLDIGCGTGALLKKLADAHDFKGYGIDVEKNMLAEAKNNCPDAEFQIASCDNIPFESGAFDVVISCLSFHHFDNREGFAKEAGRLLKPDGILYIADIYFPWLIRKIINGIFHIAGRVARFYSPQEIYSHFSELGFVDVGNIINGHGQVIQLKKVQGSQHGKKTL